MTTCDVVFYEAFEEEAEALRTCLPAGCEARFTWKTIQETGDVEPGASVISVRTQSVIPPEWALTLDGILSRSTGYDHLAAYRERVEHCPKLGYLPLYCHRAVAEQAMLLWMALLRRLPRQCRQFGRFERDGLTGAECRGKTLLVVGVGNIGHEVVDIGRGLGMDVLGVDPVRRWDDVRYLDFEDGAPRADVVAVCMNLTGRNHGYIDAARLNMLKPGAVLVNVARGELVSLVALVDSLDHGPLAGAALDVFEEEAALGVALRAEQGLPGNLALLEDLRRRDSVILTPHNAFNTAESVTRKASQSMEQIVHLTRHGTFLWPIPDNATQS